MKICEIYGTVLAQQKEECLQGKKLFLCRQKDAPKGESFVAVDLVGAGVGSLVLVSRTCPNGSSSGDLVDAYVVAIVDQVIEKA